MGQKNNAVKIKAVDSGLVIKKRTQDQRVVALAGNPNVGKSTVFNSLTQMNQHTGNWPGKTVTNAQGYCTSKKHAYVMVDIPGTYSLMAHSAEEEVARNFICFAQPDVAVVVCDATCLERNLNLVLQTLEIAPRAVVCVNMMDDAKRKHIKINLSRLSQRLGVPVVGTVARQKKTLSNLLEAIDTVVDEDFPVSPLKVKYPEVVEEAVALVEPVLQRKTQGRLNARWLSLKLLDQDESLIEEINAYFGEGFLGDAEIGEALRQAQDLLRNQGITPDTIKDRLVASLVLCAQEICQEVVVFEKQSYNNTDRKIDRILTSKWAGYPIMLALLALVFFLTITGANYPSERIADALFWVQGRLSALFISLGAPTWLHDALVLGVYRVLAWVISVMLPPMAIFFPLFTLLEDSGYLPRIAYNLDKPFKRCHACGKQALTMCMGFGCNAAAIIGCRIIDSPRERLLAILTNNFVPCNGRFPTLIAVLSMFFISASAGQFTSLLSAILLTAVIVLGIAATFATTKLLSTTILKGVPSSFTLELPPYRKPQVGKVIIRSIFDRTLFVLGRAAAIAAPAGLIIWLMANITYNGASLLAHSAAFLDPFGRLLGLDGVILIAFILGLPANEIVIPIVIMAYMAKGSLLELENLAQLKQLLVDNGWTWITAVSTMLFSLLHWPCATTLVTIKKETGSMKWTALAFLIPTLIGLSVCMLFTAIARLF